IAAGLPCRAIVIALDGNTPDFLEAATTVYSRPSPGNRSHTQVYCEEIRLTIGRDALDRARSAIEALLLPDLPVHLYHEGSISSLSPILTPLHNQIDTIIIDSETFSDDFAEARHVEALLCDPAFKTRVRDLNWARLLHWREALAYSGEAHITEFLAAIREVEILHRAGRAESLMLLGWLASRLGWQIVPGSTEPDTWLVRSALHSILLRLKMTLTGPIGLQKISLRTEQDTFDVELSEDLQCLVSRDGQRMLTPVRSPETLAGLISMAVNAHAYDRVYAEALSAAVMLSSLRDDTALAGSSGGLAT